MIALSVGCLVSAGAIANAQDPNDRVTGGGQVFLGSEGPGEGPGDTIAFVARQLRPGSEGARGEVQYVPTSSQNGQTVSTGKWHGRVTCLVVEGDEATFAGRKTSGDREPPFFQITVQDNGPEGGSGGQGNDLVLIQEDDEEFECDEQTDSEEFRLARGNATVHDGN